MCLNYLLRHYFSLELVCMVKKSDTITKERKIDEVIVVGYGKSTKAKLTDNVAKISSESLKEIP